jgi:hypothetical protein
MFNLLDSDFEKNLFIGLALLILYKLYQRQNIIENYRDVCDQSVYDDLIGERFRFRYPMERKMMLGGVYEP